MITKLIERSNYLDLLEMLGATLLYASWQKRIQIIVVVQYKYTYTNQIKKNDDLHRKEIVYPLYSK